jgi:hypothetical protein
MTKSPCRKIHEKSVNAIYCIFSEWIKNNYSFILYSLNQGSF